MRRGYIQACLSITVPGVPRMGLWTYRKPRLEEAFVRVTEDAVLGNLVSIFISSLSGTYDIYRIMEVP
jgi:hypothetical protein